jgi:sec-independent protein translocase protein TatB
MGFEMIFIFLLALILFGPKRLPAMAREIGKFVAEFKRASNDFKYQLQSEIEKAGTDAAPAPQPSAQQTTSFTQTILPPAVKSAISGSDEDHERLMRTARMAFDAQNFTLRPPAPPVPASTGPEQPGTLPGAPLPAQSSEPTAPTRAIDESHASSPVEAVTDQPTPDPAPASSNSAAQRS